MRWLLARRGCNVGQFCCHVGTVSPQAMAKILIFSAEAGGIEHHLDLAKQCHILPFDAAILLRHLMGCELKNET